MKNLIIFANGWNSPLPLILIGIAIIVVICLTKHILRVRQKKHRQQALKNYGIARRNFYFNERLKIMQHYRQRILAGTMPVDAALKDVRILLEANGNDEWTWREEYQKFAEEMETYR